MTQQITELQNKLLKIYGINTVITLDPRDKELILKIKKISKLTKVINIKIEITEEPIEITLAKTIENIVQGIELVLM